MDARARVSGRIVVGFDGSAGARHALRWAAEEACLRAAVLEVVVAWRHHSHLGLADPSDDSSLGEHAAGLLEDARLEATRERPGLEVEALAVRGDPAEVLCSEGAAADLVAVGSRGHSTLLGLLLGSVSSACAHHCSTPVAIVPRRADVADAAAGRIVVGVDGSAGSRRALRWAADEAARRDATVLAVAVWRGVQPGEDMALEYASLPSVRGHEREIAERTRRHLEESLSELPSAVGRVSSVVLEGDPAETLCEQALDSDLLVVGSRGRGPVADLLGSVSAKCAHRSPRPVVIVPTERHAHLQHRHEP